MGKPVKKYLKIDEQIEHLKKEGMHIENEDFAKEVLSKVNYYHLSGYWYKLYNNDKKFVENVTFNDIYNLYKFDSELRRLLIPLLEFLEVKLKSHIANYIGEKWGPLGYKEVDNFYEKFKDNHIVFLEKTDKKIEQYADKPVIKHHMNVYGGDIPIWALMEILSFSDLSKLYRNLNFKDTQNIIYTHYKAGPVKNNIRFIRNWIRTLCDIRNICAHYERLYDHKLTSPIKLPKKKYAKFTEVNDKLFAALIILKLLINNNNMMSDLCDKLESLMVEYEFKDLESMGFPIKWKEILTR